MIDLGLKRKAAIFLLAALLLFSASPAVAMESGDLEGVKIEGTGQDSEIVFLGYDGEDVWAVTVGFDSGHVFRLNPESGEVLSTEEFGTFSDFAVLREGKLFIRDTQSGNLKFLVFSSSGKEADLETDLDARSELYDTDGKGKAYAVDHDDPTKLNVWEGEQSSQPPYEGEIDFFSVTSKGLLVHAGGKLIWQGGEAEFPDVPDCVLGDDLVVAGEGGTVYRLTSTAEELFSTGAGGYDGVFALAESGKILALSNKTIKSFTTDGSEAASVTIPTSNAWLCAKGAFYSTSGSFYYAPFGGALGEIPEQTPPPQKTPEPTPTPTPAPSTTPHPFWQDDIYIYCQQGTKVDTLRHELVPEFDYIIDLEGNRITSGLLKTGMTVEERPPERIVVVIGDCTGNNKSPYVQRDDLEQALDFFLADMPVDDAYTRAADINYDLELTPEDLIEMNAMVNMSK